jgi:hypothetical protein
MKNVKNVMVLANSSKSQERHLSYCTKQYRHWLKYQTIKEIHIYHLFLVH